MNRFPLILCLAFGLASCHARPASSGQAASQPVQDTTVVCTQFPFPGIPEVLTSPEERKAYLLSHYWERFDFADTLLVDNRDITEQGFVNFIALLADGTTPQALVSESLHQWCSRLTASAYARRVLTQTADSYLYNPNSPFYNERLYAAYLTELLRVLPEDDAYRSVCHFKLQLLGRNNPGMQASDFIYYLPGGKSRTLSDTPVGSHLMVVFYDPECESCHEVLGRMTADPALAAAVKAGRLEVLAVYTEGNEQAWRKSLPQMPAGWTVVTDRGAVKEQALYDLKAMPSIYLLDREKRVMLKDAPYETVMETVAAEGGR